MGLTGAASELPLPKSMLGWPPYGALPKAFLAIQPFPATP